MPQRDALLLAEMIDAAEQAIALTSGAATRDLVEDRLRHDALADFATAQGASRDPDVPALAWWRPQVSCCRSPSGRVRLARVAASAA